MGGSPPGEPPFWEDPDWLKQHVFVNNELNRQFLLGQMSGNASTILTAPPKAPASATTGTTLLRSG